MNFSSSIFDQVDHFMHDGSTNSINNINTNTTNTNTDNNTNNTNNTNNNNNTKTNNQESAVRSNIVSTPQAQELLQGNHQPPFFGNSPNPISIANHTPNFNGNTGNTPFDHNSVNLSLEIDQNQQKTSVVELEAHFDELQKHFENSFASNTELNFASPNTIPSSTTTSTANNTENINNNSNNAYAMAATFKSSSSDKHTNLFEMGPVGMMEGGSPSISPTVEPKSLSNMNTPFLHPNTAANLNGKNTGPRNTSLSINTLPSPALKSIKATPDMADTKLHDNKNININDNNIKKISDNNNNNNNNGTTSIDNRPGSSGSGRLDSPSSAGSSGYKRPSKSKASAALNNSRKVTKNSPLQKPKKSPMIRSSASATMSKKFSNYSIKSNPVMSFNNNNSNNNNNNSSNGSANSNRSLSMDHAAGPGDWDEMFALPESSLPNEQLHASTHINGYAKDPSMSPFTGGMTREERNFSTKASTAGIKVILPSSASDGFNSGESDQTMKDVATKDGEFPPDKKLQVKKYGFSGSPLLNMTSAYSTDRSTRQKEHGSEPTVLRATESPVLRARKSASLTPLMSAKRAFSLESSSLGPQQQQQGSGLQESNDYYNNKHSSKYMSLTSNPDPMQIKSNDLREADSLGYQSRTSSMEKLPAASAFNDLKKTTSNGNHTGKQPGRKSSGSSNSSNNNALGYNVTDINYPHINDHDPKELFPTAKKDVHKEAEKGRRERLNNALAELGTLIPIELKATVKVPSKATTVELACDYIRQLSEKVKKFEKKS